MISLARANRSPLGVSGLTVLVDIDGLPDGFQAALEDGNVLGPDTFDLLSCSVAMSVIFGVNRPKGFEPLQLARSARRASKDQWTALKARDKGCVCCGKPPRYTEAHHIIHWKDGGLTDLRNLVLLCARCHHDLHLGYFNVTMGDDGIPLLIQGRGPPGKRTG
ncbi:MAG: HNH endonuclease signature motif containing protein [Candidatus Nanopelagicales bacterium]